MLLVRGRHPVLRLAVRAEGTISKVGGYGGRKMVNEKVTKTEARQGTGPRQMVSVLFASMALAVLAGVVLLWFFYFATPPAP